MKKSDFYEKEAVRLAEENQRLKFVLARMREAATGLAGAEAILIGQAQGLEARVKGIQELLPYADGKAYYQDKDEISLLSSKAAQFRRWAKHLNTLKEQTNDTEMVPNNDGLFAGHDGGTGPNG